MAHRINERNNGGWSLDGEPKTRKLSQKLTTNEEEVAGLVLERVIENLEYDRDLSNGRGPNYDAAIYRDNGSFTMSITKADYDLLYKAMLKMQKRYK